MADHPHIQRSVQLTSGPNVESDRTQSDTFICGRGNSSPERHMLGSSQSHTTASVGEHCGAPRADLSCLKQLLEESFTYASLTHDHSKPSEVLEGTKGHEVDDVEGEWPGDRWNVTPATSTYLMSVMSPALVETRVSQYSTDYAAFQASKIEEAILATDAERDILMVRLRNRIDLQMTKVERGDHNVDRVQSIHTADQNLDKLSQNSRNERLSVDTSTLNYIKSVIYANKECGNEVRRARNCLPHSRMSSGELAVKQSRTYMDLEYVATSLVPWQDSTNESRTEALSRARDTIVSSVDFLDGKMALADGQSLYAGRVETSKANTISASVLYTDCCNSASLQQLERYHSDSTTKRTRAYKAESPSIKELETNSMVRTKRQRLLDSTEKTSDGAIGMNRILDSHGDDLDSNAKHAQQQKTQHLIVQKPPTVDTTARLALPHLSTQELHASKAEYSLAKSGVAKAPTQQDIWSLNYDGGKRSDNADLGETSCLDSKRHDEPRADASKEFGSEDCISSTTAILRGMGQPFLYSRRPGLVEVQQEPRTDTGCRPGARGSAGHESATPGAESHFSLANKLENFLQLHGIYPSADNNILPSSSSASERSFGNEESLLPNMNKHKMNSIRLSQANQAYHTFNALSRGTVVLSPRIFTKATLVQQLQSMLPNVEFMEGGSMTEVDGRDMNHHTRTRSDTEADMILSPSIGLILTELQTLQQKPLPGQRLVHNEQERIGKVSLRFERLFVLVSNHRDIYERPFVPSSLPCVLGEQDTRALAEFLAFAASSMHGVEVCYVGNDGSQLSERIAYCISQFAFVDEQTLSPYKSEPLRFLHHIGLNTVAAQKVVRQLYTSGMQSVDSNSRRSNSRLASFIGMSHERRIEQFASTLGGERVLTRLDRLFSQSWK